MYDEAMKTTEARIGFAADDDGGGVAYVRLDGGPHALRIPFRISRFPAMLGREVAYGALIAVSWTLARREIRRVRFFIEDSRVIEDLRERRDLPAVLTLPYMRLRCALNLFESAE